MRIQKFEFDKEDILIPCPQGMGDIKCAFCNGAGEVRPDIPCEMCDGMGMVWIGVVEKDDAED